MAHIGRTFNYGTEAEHQRIRKYTRYIIRTEIHTLTAQVTTKYLGDHRLLSTAGLWKP